MPTIEYIDKTFQAKTLAMIEQANIIIDNYQAQGFSLTLRQLYYQLVSRNLIRNKQSEYKRLGSIINDARLAGLVDWYAIEDRTRNLVGNSHWDSPKSIVNSAVRSYAIDKWDGQDQRPEVWIEKDALTGVIAGACRRLDIDFFSCRGYASASEMWRAGQRIMRRDYEEAQETVILHLADHDPSGLDMTRDIEERLSLFAEMRVEVRRIALNMEQIQQYGPPPNPAKLSDSRASNYVYEYGRDSWELDALEPTVLTGLIEDEVLQIRDEDIWSQRVRQEGEHKRLLRAAAASLDL